MHFVAVHFERGNGQENAINNIHLAAVYLILQENEVNNMHFVAMHFERGNGQENAINNIYLEAVYLMLCMLDKNYWI
jgi:hypothetical protein